MHLLASASLRLQCYAVSFFVYASFFCNVAYCKLFTFREKLADCECVLFLATPFCVIFFSNICKSHFFCTICVLQTYSITLEKSMASFGVRKLALFALQTARRCFVIRDKKSCIFKKYNFFSIFEN